MIAWRAFRNMLRAAARDPAWALVAIPLNLFRGAKYVLGTLLACVFVLLVLSLLFRLITEKLGFGHNSLLLAALNFVAMAATAVFLFRRATAPMIRHFGDLGGDTHGTARFATPAETRPLMQSADGLLLGRDPNTGKLLRYAGNSHLMTMAPTRTGKGTGTLIPNLLTLRRSVICIDPKGENVRVTYRARSRLGPVHVLDPFGVTGQPSAAFNPLAALDPASPDLAEDTATLADALVYDAPGEAGEAHWNEEAKALIAGLLLHIVTSELPARRTLALLREHLTCAPRF